VSPNLKVSQEGRVRRLTLARPEKGNALTREMCHALLRALHEADEDAGTSCLLLDAEGKVFCTGLDLEETPAADASHERLFSVGGRISKPIVAAVQGPALAGGVGLLANCHCVVAAMGSSFGLTEMRHGMFPVISFRAVALAIGERRALELALTGRVFQTDEALRLGLIHAVAPEIELDDRATGLANQIASFSPQTVRLGMTFAHQQRTLDQEGAGRLATVLREEMLENPDYAEGVAALQGRRRPVWPSIG
jgi:enoyl-CoA hydratase/carnithine racemase